MNTDQHPPLLKLQLSDRRSDPFLMAVPPCAGDGDQLSGNGGDNDLVRFSRLAEATKAALEYHVPRNTATTCNGSFPAEGPLRYPTGPDAIMQHPRECVCWVMLSLSRLMALSGPPAGS